MPIHQGRFDLSAGAIANIDQQRPQSSTFPVREMREGEPQQSATRISLYQACRLLTKRYLVIEWLWDHVSEQAHSPSKLSLLLRIQTRR